MWYLLPINPVATNWPALPAIPLLALLGALAVLALATIVASLCPSRAEMDVERRAPAASLLAGAVARRLGGTHAA